MADRIQIERSVRVSLTGERPSIQRKRTGRDAPNFDSMFEADENPLDGLGFDGEVGDIQASADREMSAVEQEIERNRAASAERFRIGSDEGYYCVLCFQTTEQKEEFLTKAGWMDIGDKYLNGLEVAEKLGIELAIISIEPRRLRANPKKFTREEVI